MFCRHAKVPGFENVAALSAGDGSAPAPKRTELDFAGKPGFAAQFFHSRQDGGTGFRMAAWTSACRKLEEHLLAGGQIALLTSRLLELQNLFEEEASSVDRRLAEKRND